MSIRLENLEWGSSVFKNDAHAERYEEGITRLMKENPELEQLFGSYIVYVGILTRIMSSQKYKNNEVGCDIGLHPSVVDTTLIREGNIEDAQEPHRPNRIRIYHRPENSPPRVRRTGRHLEGIVHFTHPLFIEYDGRVYAERREDTGFIVHEEGGAEKLIESDNPLWQTLCGLASLGDLYEESLEETGT